MWAVVPLKSPDAAKTRLRPALDDRQRRAVFFAMARRVITSLVGAPGVERVAVVTASRDVERFACGLGADTIRLSDDAGTAQACIAAVDALRPRRLERLLMMAGDLPLASREVLAPLLAAGTTSPGVVIVPDRRGLGTNALLCSPPDAIPICFGQDSLRQHVAAARARGIQPVLIRSEFLGLDVDVPEDLALWRAHAGALAVEAFEGAWLPSAAAPCSAAAQA